MYLNELKRLAGLTLQEGPFYKARQQQYNEKHYYEENFHFSRLDLHHQAKATFLLKP